MANIIIIAPDSSAVLFPVFINTDEKAFYSYGINGEEEAWLSSWFALSRRSESLPEHV